MVVPVTLDTLDKLTQSTSREFARTEEIPVFANDVSCLEQHQHNDWKRQISRVEPTGQ